MSTIGYPFRKAHEAIQVSAYKYVRDTMAEMSIDFELEFLSRSDLDALTTIDPGKLPGTLYSNWLRMPVANKDPDTSNVSRIVSIVRREDEHHIDGSDLVVRILRLDDHDLFWQRLSIVKNYGTDTLIVDLADYLARYFES